MFIIKQTAVGKSIVYEILRNKNGQYLTFKDAAVDLEREGAKQWSKISGSALYVKVDDEKIQVQAD